MRRCTGDTQWRSDGLRDFFLYKDLGVADATNGKVIAQLVKANLAPEKGTGWRRHVADFPIVVMAKAFYDEYFAVLDLPAEFYLETVRSVFQEHYLALGRLKYGDRIVDPSKIRRTALLTVEGERDDICAIGQTVAAQEVCSGIRPYLKSHYVQMGVGHYGVFSGRKWNSGVYPMVREMIHVTA